MRSSSLATLGVGSLRLFPVRKKEVVVSAGDGGKEAETRRWVVHASR